MCGLGNAGAAAGLRKAHPVSGKAGLSHKLRLCVPKDLGFRCRGMTRPAVRAREYGLAMRICSVSRASGH